jgi:tetratricopeptide (TPR) repeat protein
MEPDRLLQPLADAEPAIRTLTEYTTPAEITDALEQVWAALERTLRLLLRSDPSVSDAVRMSAFSAAELPSDRVLEELRARQRISMQVAGMTHELRQSVERARVAGPRAADADLALQTVSRLRGELLGLSMPQPLDTTSSPGTPVAAPAGETGERDVPLHASGVEGHPHRFGAAWSGRRGPPLVALALAALAVILLVAVAVWWLRRDTTMTEAVAAFEAGRLQAAEAGFRQVVARRPDDVTAYLYLGRIYRRQDRQDEAARVLQEAVRLDPDDPTVRRELGYLFMDLNRPQAAAEQFRRALTDQPDVAANWIGLIRALRAAGDPAAEDLLRRAPPDVRALFPD